MLIARTMGKGKRFDKRSATTYTVVHRSHEDSLYYDNDATRHVLVELPSRIKNGQNGQIGQTGVTAEDSEPITKPSKPKPKTEIDVELRENEGFAAQYGIFFDDSKYDYLQHLKPMGQEGGFFIEATAAKPRKKTIEDLLKDQLPSEKTRKVTLDETENVPEDLRGFNPDMDPRLREVLQALDDEAYLEENCDDAQDADDLFTDLLRSGEAGEDDISDEGYDEWDMDNHQDEFDHYDGYDLNQSLDDSGDRETLEVPYNKWEAPEGLESDLLAAAGTSIVNSAWEKDFKRYIQSRKASANDWDSDNELNSVGANEIDALGDLPTIKGKKKKKNDMRKKMGAMTDTSTFSMSSSANFRTQGLMLLDDRYEQMANKFQQPSVRNNQEFSYQNERLDLEDMLDDFLDTYELERGGRRLMKKNAKLDAFKQAADSVSRLKLAARRQKEQSVVCELENSFISMAL